MFHEFEILPADVYDAMHNLGTPIGVTVVSVEVPYGTAPVLRIPLPGVVGSPSIAAGDLTITTDAGTGAENVDNAPSIVGNTLVWTISAAEATAPSTNGPHRVARLRDQTSPKVFGDVDIHIITTDHQSAVKSNGVQRQVTPDATPGATSFAVTDATLPSTPLGAGFINCVALIVTSDVATDVTPASTALITNYSKTGDVGTFTYAGGWNRTPTGTAANIRINLIAGAIGSTEKVGSQVDARLLTSTSKTVADLFFAIIDQSTGQLDAGSFAASSLPGQGAPTATPTLYEAIMYLFKAWRNKHTQTSSEYALYADDTTTKDQEAAVTDDGTTLTRGEVATGA